MRWIGLMSGESAQTISLGTNCLLSWNSKCPIPADDVHQHHDA